MKRLSISGVFAFSARRGASAMARWTLPASSAPPGQGQARRAGRTRSGSRRRRWPRRRGAQQPSGRADAALAGRQADPRLGSGQAGRRLGRRRRRRCRRECSIRFRFSRGRARSTTSGRSISSSRTPAARRPASRDSSRRRTGPSSSRCRTCSACTSSTTAVRTRTGSSTSMAAQFPRQDRTDQLRLLDRSLGRRHARRRNARTEREVLAGHARHPAHRAAEVHRALHPPEHGHAAVPGDDRRSRRLHAAVDDDRSSSCGDAPATSRSSTSASSTTRDRS